MPPKSLFFLTPQKREKKVIEKIIGRKTNVFYEKESYLRRFPLSISVNGIRLVISQNKFSFKFTCGLNWYVILKGNKP